MKQDRNRDQDVPSRQSNMEQVERSRSSERGRGSDGERNRAESGQSNSGGITNRPLDRERCEQDNLPERGRSQSER